MATLYVTEFSTIGTSINAQAIQVARQAPVAEQTVAIGGSSTQSSAFNVNTNLIRLHTDAICSVSIGTNPTATAAKMRMSADKEEYFHIPVNSTYKVAVITNS